jgi:hypothetical protein
VQALARLAGRDRRPWLAALVLLIAVAVALDVSDGSGDDSRPVLAYITGTATSVPQVWLADADGRRPRRLGEGTRPLAAPDGSTVAASAPGLSGPALTLYRTTGSSARRFFDAARATAIAQAWSSDSRYLAVVLSSTDPNSDAPSGLAVLDTESDRYRIVAHGQVYGASFAPDGSDSIAYASAASGALGARTDLHVVRPDGTQGRQITHDGRSLNPVWGPHAIAFDRERLRDGAAPAYQVWTTTPDGNQRAQLTDVPVPPLLDGLVPIGFSADGSTLLAEYVGQDTSEAWAITVATRRTRQLRIDGRGVAAAATAHRGALALVDLGGYLNAPDRGIVEALPLIAGRPTVLTRHGADPSWNR